MKDKQSIARDWLTRYTGMALDDFGDYVLLTNFRDYVTRFAERFGCDISGEDRPMQAATNSAGLSIVNFGIGSPNAATIMDLLRWAGRCEFAQHGRPNYRHYRPCRGQRLAGGMPRSRGDFP